MAKLSPLEPGHSLGDRWHANYIATNYEKRAIFWLMYRLGKSTVSETWRHIFWRVMRSYGYEGPYPGDFELAALQATPIATEEDDTTTSKESTTGTSTKGTHKTHARHTAPRRGSTPQPTITADTSGSDSETTSGQTTEALILVS